MQTGGGGGGVGLCGPSGCQLEPAPDGSECDLSYIYIYRERERYIYWSLHPARPRAPRVPGTTPRAALRCQAMIIIEMIIIIIVMMIIIIVMIIIIIMIILIMIIIMLITISYDESSSYCYYYYHYHYHCGNRPQRLKEMGGPEVSTSRRRENMVGVIMVLASYPQNTLYHRIYIGHV